MSASQPSRAAIARCCHITSRQTQVRSRCLPIIIQSQSSASSQRSRQSRRQLLQQQEQRRYESTAAATAGGAAPTNPKISSIVDQIGQLTLLETADLVASLKSRLNIPDMAFAAPSASVPGAAGGGAAAPAAEAEAEEAAPAAAEKTMFTLRLEKFDAAAKAKVIKEVKAMLGLSLVDSKKFVESAPKVLKEGVPKEEAEKIVAAMKALGAEVKMD